VLQYFRKIWRDIGRPSVHYSIGALTLGGFIAGIAHELPDMAGVEGYD
jgi:cytochrome c-type protein NapC